MPKKSISESKILTSLAKKCQLVGRLLRFSFKVVLLIWDRLPKIISLVFGRIILAFIIGQMVRLLIIHNGMKVNRMTNKGHNNVQSFTSEWDIGPMSIVHMNMDMFVHV